jgi:hypothetical protein
MLKFKDPTPEEIEQFEKTYVPSAVSSPVPVAEEPIMEEPSTASDFLKAAGQGATLGFGDELLAALRAGSEVALGKPEMSDLAELYRKYQKINEEAYKQAQERSPMATLAGEISGGFLIPGGAAIRGAKALGATSKLGQAALSGALIGGVAGVGQEKGGASLGELTEAGATGAAIGGGLGAVSRGMGALYEKGTQGIKKYIQESPAVLRAIHGAKLEKLLGEELDTIGTAIASKEGTDIVVQKVNNTVNDIVDSLAANREKYGKQVFQIYEKAKGKIPLNDKTYNSILNEAQENPEFASLLKSFNKNVTSKLISGQADLKDLVDLRKSILQNIRRKKELQLITDDDLEKLIGTFGDDKRLSGGLVNTIDNLLESKLPGLRQARTEYQKAAEIPEMIINRSDDPLDHVIKLYDKTDEQVRQSLKKEITRYIAQIGGRSFQSVEKENLLKRIAEAMRTRPTEGMETVLGKTAKIKPEIPGASPADVFQRKVEEAGKDVAVLKTLLGDKPLTDENIKQAMSALGPTGIVETGLTEAAVSAARAGKTLAPVAKGLKKYSVDQLRGFAEMLRKNPATKEFGENAVQALNNPSDAAQAAFINQVMQDPKKRQLLGISVNRKEEE